MADFDAIYEEQEDDEALDDAYVKSVPDPVIVRGSGNMTVYVLYHTMDVTLFISLFLFALITFVLVPKCQWKCVCLLK